MLNSPSRRRAHGKKHGVQGIVVEFVATGQCIVVEMFEARFPCQLYLLTSLSRFRLLHCVSKKKILLALTVREKSHTKILKMLLKPENLKSNVNFSMS